MSDLYLSKEDYEEPRCPLSKPCAVSPISVDRVIEKLDGYLHRNDYDGARQHLDYWLAEAQSGNDRRGALTILNEQIGLYRKTDNKEAGLRAIDAALQLVRDMGLDGTVTMGTTWINAATAYKAFGRAEDALPLYRQAQEVYESTLSPQDARLGGLYNNMALTLMALGAFGEARSLFDRALEIMETNARQLEIAITLCNLADLTAEQYGTETGEAQINTYLDRALAIFEDPQIPKDGYYAFVCEKCAPTFGYYGYFLAEKDLLQQAKEIYERT